MSDSRLEFEFESISACMLCNSSKRIDVKGVSWKGIAFSYCICSQCGLKYMHPRPTKTTYELFYRDKYWQDNLAGSGFPTLLEYSDPRIAQLELRMAKYKAVYRRLIRDLSSVMKLGSQVRILEVGCAFGFSLEW